MHLAQVLNLAWRFGLIVKTTRFACGRMSELMDAAGARKTWTQPVGDTYPNVHLMGACRMGHDPKASVVDSDHRAHDGPNLFIADGSSLVTCGRQQPTATIQALAFRAADRVAVLAKSGRI